MARLDVSRLPNPPAGYRIDRLPAGPEGTAIFETRGASRDEDDLRARRLRSSAPSPLVNNDAAAELANCLAGPISQCDGRPPSSRYMRKFRIQIIGHLWRLIEDEGWQREGVTAFTVLPRGWEFTPETLHQADPRRLLDRLRGQLKRAGSGDADGFLIASIHGEFDPEEKIYRLHAHGFAAGGMIGVLDGLRTLPAYRPRPSVTVPMQIRRKPLDNLPYPLGYPFKGYWPSRRIGPVGDTGTIKRQRGHHRIPEPYHSQVLLWLDRWSVADMTLLMNLRVGPAGLVASPKKTSTSSRRTENDPLQQLREPTNPWRG